jgi:GT2 family glycosyltransferase
MVLKRMRLKVNVDGPRLEAALPPGAPGAWCVLRLGLADPAPWWAKLELTDEARGQVVRDVFLGPLRRRGAKTWRDTLVHVPRDSRALMLTLFQAAGAGASVELRVLPRWRAAMALLARGCGDLPGALAGSPLGALGRVRAVLGQGPARAGEAPPYSTWIALYEGPPAPAPAWDVTVVVAGGPAAARDASLASAAPARRHAVAAPGDWLAIASPWVVLLQAGEILAPGALAAFAQAAADCPWAELLTADCDRLTAQGERTDPLFKPGPDPVLLRSGLTVRGACAVRWRAVPAALPVTGQAAKLALALRDPARIAHIPRILSHIRADCEASEGLVAPSGAVGSPHVTMVVPSAARGAHVVRCLSRMTRDTAYPAFDIKVVVSAPGAPAVYRRLAQLPRVSILPVQIGAFNYAAVNNAAAESVSAALLLLVNDDVAPVSPRWLDAMVCQMHDPTVGIVGARLLYGNETVQHEGVIMGLANLCEHAGRLRSAADAGRHGLGLLDRDVSAVTGACLLIRTALYRELGGMDTGFAVALNDVDLCLRARAAGWRVVYCASATLHHYESLSLGRHYDGARAGLESQEVRRLRARHGAVIAADPFYSPNASLQPGREWQPAFPPRPHPRAVGSAPRDSETSC